MNFKNNGKIIVHLAGGLGNQMFQYAFGRSLCLSTGRELWLDLSHYKRDGLRIFELNYYKIDGIIMPNCSVISQFSGSDRLIRLIGKIQVKFNKHTQVIYEDLNVSIEIENIPLFKRDIYLVGYWQNEKYFSKYRKQIIEDFTPKEKVKEPYYTELLNNIKNEQAVSVHVRRGDYLQKKIALSHGILGEDYYRNALSRFSELVPQIKFYFFSDDPEWVRETFSDIKHKEIVNGRIDQLDLLCMSQCKHHIIANSSFSWWGAWLNTSLNKKVIAPSQWYKNFEMNRKSIDIVPSVWFRL